ncbi:MAG: hypothetical protein Ct9H300mP9_3580 [Candidatus Neomarinimicrobiota bacterium]|nr:MAG: hypothetical protein Ct9H300mP9_3580 [Candidatus Neomarinimicrobiota bacterium]
MRSLTSNMFGFSRGGVDPEIHHIAPFSAKELIRDGHKIDLGDRVLKVLSTPGHTPDSYLCSIKRKVFMARKIFFYAGPIWLFFPETDFDEFYSSVDRLCSLVPELKKLHPSHNSPIALPKLYKAQGTLLSGERRFCYRGTLSGDRVEYVFNGFSLIMRSPVDGPDYNYLKFFLKTFYLGVCVRTVARLNSITKFKKGNP